MTTEAVKTKSRRLELGSSLSGFMAELGLSAYTGGGKQGRVTIPAARPEARASAHRMALAEAHEMGIRVFDLDALVRDP